jgi:hypothetical protein
LFSNVDVVGAFELDQELEGDYVRRVVTGSRFIERQRRPFLDLASICLAVIVDKCIVESRAFLLFLFVSKSLLKQQEPEHQLSARSRGADDGAMPMRGWFDNSRLIV